MSIALSVVAAAAVFFLLYRLLRQPVIVSAIAAAVVLCVTLSTTNPGPTAPNESAATGETVKLQLSGTMPATGARVAVIFSCNGMDVVQVYTREGATPAEVEELADEIPEKEAPVQEDTLVQETPVEEVTEETPPAEEIPGRSYPEPIPDELETVGLPLGKIIMLAGLAILAIVDLLWMFRKRRK